MAVKLVLTLKDRDSFFEWAWRELQVFGLAGIHEGTVLAQANEVDSAIAPPDRDWVRDADMSDSELYFNDQSQAEKAAQLILNTWNYTSRLEWIPEQDWNEAWKQYFLGSKEGIFVPPFWRILPPWCDFKVLETEKKLTINPGAGFGTGTHETTKLCLEQLGVFAEKCTKLTVLDFGSGSGVLSVAAASLGAQVDAVEIDPLAIENARENAKLNQLEAQIHFFQSFEDRTQEQHTHYDVVVANILKPVLIEYANRLVERLKPCGRLILSGLLEADLSPVQVVFEKTNQLSSPKIQALGEWRCLVYTQIPR